MAWLWLIAGGLCEVAFTTCLRHADGFRHAGWTLGFVVAVSLSMLLLDRAARTISLGTAYAVWTGVGALGTVLIGILWYDEPATPLRLLLILGAVACIAGLKLLGPET